MDWRLTKDVNKIRRTSPPCGIIYLGEYGLLPAEATAAACSLANTAAEKIKYTN